MDILVVGVSKTCFKTTHFLFVFFEEVSSGHLFHGRKQWKTSQAAHDLEFVKKKTPQNGWRELCPGRIWTKKSQQIHFFLGWIATKLLGGKNSNSGNYTIPHPPKNWSHRRYICCQKVYRCFGCIHSIKISGFLRQLVGGNVEKFQGANIHLTLKLTNIPLDGSELHTLGAEKCYVRMSCWNFVSSLVSWVWFHKGTVGWFRTPVN